MNARAVINAALWRTRCSVISLVLLCIRGNDCRRNLSCLDLSFIMYTNHFCIQVSTAPLGPYQSYAYEVATADVRADPYIAARYDTITPCLEKVDYFTIISANVDKFSQVLSRVSALCMQNAILFYQFRLSICLSNVGIVYKRVHISPHFLTI